MKNNKYHIGLAVFVATVACSSFLFGWFLSEWAYSIDREKNKMDHVATLLQNITCKRETRILDNYGYFRRNVEMLESFIKEKEKPRDPRATERLISLYKNEVKSLLPTADAMMSIIKDTEMRENLATSIQKAKSLLETTHNNSSNSTGADNAPSS